MELHQQHILNLIHQGCDYQAYIFCLYSAEASCALEAKSLGGLRNAVEHMKELMAFAEDQLVAMDQGLPA